MGSKFSWVVLLVERLVSTKIFRHPCEVEVVDAVFPKRVFPLSGDNFGFGAAEDLWFSRCLGSDENT